MEAKQNKRINDGLVLILAILGSNAAGFIGSFATITSIGTWYAGLEKPALNPPNWIFGPVWTTLYTLMGVAAFLVWKKGKGVKRYLALSVFFLQLILNALWSVLFFGLEMPEFAFVELAVMWVAILLTIILFWRISKTAAALLIPYICWVTFAGYLNLSIALLN